MLFGDTDSVKFILWSVAKRLEWYSKGDRDAVTLVSLIVLLLVN